MPSLIPALSLLVACENATPEEVVQAPQVEEALEITKPKIPEPPQVTPSKSRLLDKAYEAPLPAGLSEAISDEDLETLKNDFEAQLKRLNGSFDEDVKGNSNKVGAFLKDFLVKMAAFDETGASTQDVVETFNRREIEEIEALLGTYLHPLGFHSVVSLYEDGTVHIDIYPIESSQWIEVSDHLETAEFPALFLGAKLIPEGRMQAVPEAAGAKAEFDQGRAYMLIFDGFGEQNAKHNIGQLEAYGFTPPTEEEMPAFVESNAAETLDHEGNHLLLLTKRFPKTSEWEGCIPSSIHATVEGWSTVSNEGCFRAFELHEVCGYAAEYAHGGPSIIWSSTINLDSSFLRVSPNYGPTYQTSILLFLANQGPGPRRDLLTQAFDETGGKLPYEALANYMREDVGQAGVNAVGEEMYQFCYATLEALESAI